MKKNIGLLIIVVLLLTAVTATITYAYFGANVVGEGKDVKANTGKLNLRIDDTSISSNESSPIYDEDY